MKDYVKELRARLKKVSREPRPVSDHYEDCLKVMVDIYSELINEVQSRRKL